MPPKFKRNVSHDDILAADETERTGLLKDDESDEEDFFLKGPPKNKGLSYQDGKLQEVRAQVREVEGVMRENIEKVLERGDRLDTLQEKSESMATSADYFSATSKRLRKAIWWRDMKMKILLGVVVVTILLLIFVPIIIQQTKK